MKKLRSVKAQIEIYEHHVVFRYPAHNPKTFAQYRLQDVYVSDGAILGPIPDREPLYRGAVEPQPEKQVCTLSTDVLRKINAWQPKKKAA